VFVIFFATFGAVFIAEIVGDKLLYTTGVLAARYRTLPIIIGMGAAFMAKMGVAVLIGEAISKLPKLLVASITAISFIGVAITLWRRTTNIARNAISIRCIRPR
jgi:putative Ca2+/H+ antiporter (TMEM165/GDT1 family)